MTVTRETLKQLRQLLCTKCRREPRRKGQRWCNECFAKFQRKWSKDNTKLRRDLRRIVAEHFKGNEA